MRENYIINKYAMAILEGLGYEVLKEKGKHQEPILVNKESKLKLNYKIRDKLELLDDEWETGLSEFYSGTPNVTYEGIHGECISIEKYGRTKIFFANGYKINISNHNPNQATMNIALEFDKKEIDISYYGMDIEKENERLYSLRNNISIDTIDPSKNMGRIEQKKTSWGNFFSRYSVENCTPEQVTEEIINIIRNNQIEGYEWNDTIKGSLEIIAPALAIMAIDFKKDWIKYLDEYVKEENKQQNDTMSEIKLLIDEISQSKIREDSYKKTSKVLKRSLRPIQKQRRDVIK